MKNSKYALFLVLLLSSLTTTALPNPAAVNCTNKGGHYLLVRNVGVCVFSDFSYCEEWAFFKGNCVPGQNKAGMGTTVPPVTPANPNMYR